MGKSRKGKRKNKANIDADAANTAETGGSNATTGPRDSASGDDSENTSSTAESAQSKDKVEIEEVSADIEGQVLSSTETTEDLKQLSPSLDASNESSVEVLDQISGGDNSDERNLEEDSKVKLVLSETIREKPEDSLEVNNQNHSSDVLPNVEYKKELSTLEITGDIQKTNTDQALHLIPPISVQSPEKTENHSAIEDPLPKHSDTTTKALDSVSRSQEDPSESASPEKISRHSDNIDKSESSSLSEKLSSTGTTTNKETSVDLLNPPILPKGWFLKKLLADLSLSPGETITCVSSYESNIYVGTSKGQLLHLYLFEDADQYIPILELKVGEANSEPITKILVVPDAEMCLVLAGKIVYSFTLPELSPCRIGKVKDAGDLSLLSVGKSPNEKNKNDKIIVYTLSKIRVLHVIKTGFKLLRDINYSGALYGLSSATGTSAHYSNICIIANDTRYDVVDMQQARKIPLFDYNPGSVQGIEPNLVPYIAEDLKKPREEYLLSICTEESTSMAMFINSAGDVTRGTLTWVDRGYPKNGIVIEWPYVIGIFGKISQDGMTLVVSSLESLETTISVSCDVLFKGLSDHPSHIKVVNSGNEIRVADEELSYFLSRVSGITKEPVSLQKQFTSAKAVFCDDAQLFYFQKRSGMASGLNEILDIVKNTDLDNLEEKLAQKVGEFEMVSSSDSFHFAMYLVLLLVSGEYENLKSVLLKSDQKYDPRLLLLFCVDFSDIEGELWQNFTAERFFFDLHEMFPKPKSTRAFYSWLIRHVHSNKDAYDQDISAPIRKLVYTETCQNADETLAMIDVENDIWSGQSAVNDQLVQYFEANKMYVELLHVYMLRQSAGNTFEEWPLKIIDLCLDLVGGLKIDREYPKKDVMAINTHRFDLLDIAFRQLKENIEDEVLYTKKLLSLLQLRPDRGLVLLKSAKGGRFASTHKPILEELSKSHKFDAKFILLKIEYAEQSFLETSKDNKVDLNICNELLQDYVEYLNQEDLEIGPENLNILYLTYTVENNLTDSVWPKVTWIEYLHLHFGKSDCQEYLTVYLKAYEMLVLLAMCEQKADTKFSSKSDAFSYLGWIVKDGPDRIDKLRNINDYSTAEWLAVYSFPPVPRSTFFLNDLAKKELLVYPEHAPEKVTANVASLLQFYLDLDDPTARNSSVMHALATYADKHLSLGQVFDMLPENFPVMYAETYLSAEIHRLENTRTDTRMIKALHKSKSRLDAAVLEDFERTLQNAQQLSKPTKNTSE